MVYSCHNIEPPDGLEELFVSQCGHVSGAKISQHIRIAQQGGVDGRMHGSIHCT